MQLLFRARAIWSAEPPPEASVAHRPRRRRATTHSEGQQSTRSRPEPRTDGRQDSASARSKPHATVEHGEDGEDAALPAASMVALSPAVMGNGLRRDPRRLQQTSN